MISFLTEAVLIGALAITSWRTGIMYRELRHLRSNEAAFGKSLEEADAAINRAAHAVIVLKTEGVKTLAGLEARIFEAGEAAERLQFLVRSADLRAALADADDTAFAAPALGVSAERDGGARAFSRFASGTPAIR